MFISLDLRTCNLGTAVRTGKNPFTGQLVEFPIDDGLTQAEKTAVRKLLTDVNATPADEEGWRTVFFDDDTKINVGLGAFESDLPCVAFEIEFNPTSSLAVSFIFNLARVANMAVGSSIDPNVVALVASPNERVGERWPNATITITPEQLGAWLRKCIDDGSIV